MEKILVDIKSYSVASCLCAALRKYKQKGMADRALCKLYEEAYKRGISANAICSVRSEALEIVNEVCEKEA